MGTSRDRGLAHLKGEGAANVKKKGKYQTLRPTTSVEKKEEHSRPRKKGMPHGGHRNAGKKKRKGILSPRRARGGDEVVVQRKRGSGTPRSRRNCVRNAPSKGNTNQKCTTQKKEKEKRNEAFSCAVPRGVMAAWRGCNGGKGTRSRGEGRGEGSLL